MMLETKLKDPRDQKIYELLTQLNAFQALVGAYMFANGLTRIEGPRPDMKQIANMNLILKTEGEGDEIVFVAEILAKTHRGH